MSSLMERLKLFLALSRTPHGLLDLATPMLAALLWLGHPPPLTIILVGGLAAFAGYTAIYALNDIVDYRVDRKKPLPGSLQKDDHYLDAAFVRHPLARGFLSLPEAVIWAGGWGLVALFAAWWLNPACALLLVAGCILETIYCLLLRVSHLRVLISGVVKTLGGLAAVLAVDSDPEPSLLVLLFLWLFFWEIGGQNVPADWHDIEEDEALQARTIPVRYGPGGASILIVVALFISVALSGLFLFQASLRLPLPLFLAGLSAGVLLLLLPAFRLLNTQSKDEAGVLFNRASYYPASLLAIATVSLLF
jgi:4-hydroxybenzoate polyprenyltransferase